MGKNELYKNKIWLVNEYSKRTISDLAKECGISDTALRYWIIKFGIPLRTGCIRNNTYQNKEWLVEHYINKQLTCLEIAKLIGTTDGIINYWLVKFDIPRRDVNNREGDYRNPEILRKWYIEENKTLKEIAKLCHISASVVGDWIMKFDIPMKPAHKRIGLPLSERQKEGYRKLSQKFKGRALSEEWRNNISQSKKGKNHPNFGKKCHSHGKRVWYKCPNGEIVSMRSNWEASYADWLNQNNINWEYEPKTFELHDGSAYTPDFFLPDKKQYVEVKGWLHETHKAKIDKFRETYPDLDLVVANKKYLQEIDCDLMKEHPSNKPSIRKVCGICNVEFKPNFKQQKFCSIKCRNKYISTSPKQEKVARKKRPGKYNQIGSNNNSTKLTEEKVLEIIKLWKSGGKIKDISAMFDVSEGNIGNIVSGRSWKHIER
jgi:hypothetical protein